MSMTFEPGCINDRICVAITRAGGAATYKVLARSNICNDSVLDVALGALVRDGLLRRDEASCYVLSAELAAEYSRTPPLTPDTPETDNSPAPSSSAPRQESESTSKGEEISMPKMKECRTCERSKPADRDHFGSANRSPDLLTADCLDCRGESKPARTSTPQASRPTTSTDTSRSTPAPAAAPVQTIAAAAPYVIPATGSAECRVHGHGLRAIVEVTQRGHAHDYTLGQAQALRDWLDCVLKQEMGRSAA